ncbi:protein phosphatase [Pseudozyma hubeiensis SY62]|uniref:Protein phosphatase n=1 Tax=Pseudozyma hubeiensis (strain SY62) TaxID=1305764 RepID=R9P1D0_PSEHS|nr:protein phosphatase [Pseudozyma hubeiensis SY62]GAC95098.1 protein phosphatase [Pseudozyma hubeiensis SY62]
MHNPSASAAQQNNAGLRPPSAGAPPRTPSQTSSHRSNRAHAPAVAAAAAAPPSVKSSFASSEPPLVIDGPGGRIACVADVRGNLSLFNQIAAETRAQAIIHTGDFGFYDNASLDRISDRTLRHLVQYSTLIDPALRARLLAADPPRGPAATEKGTSAAAMRQHIAQQHNGLPLSEFSDLLTGKIKLQVPVFTVWGACEDVAILERFRTGEYQVNNLHVLDEATTKSIEVGGIRLRLFGLGGALVLHKLFDNGEGAATIAGGQGTMWTTALQIGELVDTAQKTFDPTETRLLITHASPGREGLLAQLALALKADLTVSAGLHFRYGVSYNEFSVQHDAENYRNKLQHAKHAFGEIWDTVKTQVDAVIDDNQRMLLNNALAVANRVAPTATATGAASEEPAWKNTWNWNLPDAAYGNVVLSIRDGRVSAETKSQGFNFAYRRSGQPMSAVTPTAAPGSVAIPAATPVAPAAKGPQATAPSSAAPAAAAQRNNVTPASVPTAPAKATNTRSIEPTNGAAAASTASSAAPTPASKATATAAVTTTTAAAAAPSSTKPTKEKKERPTRTERGHESVASRSDLDGGLTSGTDGRKSPSSSSAPRKPRNPFTLYVSQLKEALPVTEEELRTYFGPAAGGIAGIKLVFDKPHRRGPSSGKEDAGEVQRRQRPFAYVEFKDEAAMQAGLGRQGEVLKGDIRPALEQADSNKQQGEAEKAERVEKRERVKKVDTDKEEDTGKSGDEKAKGRQRKERGNGKEKGEKADKATDKAAPTSVAGVESSTAETAVSGAPASSHNKNKKKNNSKDKRDKRDKPDKADKAATVAPSTAAAGGEKKETPPEAAAPSATPAPAPAAPAPAANAADTA